MSISLLFQNDCKPLSTLKYIFTLPAAQMKINDAFNVLAFTTQIARNGVDSKN